MAIAINNKATAQDIIDLVTLKEKAADQTVNDSVVLVNDTHLLIPMTANEEWAFDAYLFYTGNALADIKFAFTVPAAGVVLQWSIVGTSGAAFQIIHVSASATSATNDTNGATVWASYIRGVCVNGANAGNLQLQWAQQAAHASNTDLKRGSWLRGHLLSLT